MIGLMIKKKKRLIRKGKTLSENFAKKNKFHRAATDITLKAIQGSVR